MESKLRLKNMKFDESKLRSDGWKYVEFESRIHKHGEIGLGIEQISFPYYDDTDQKDLTGMVFTIEIFLLKDISYIFNFHQGRNRIGSAGHRWDSIGHFVPYRNKMLHYYPEIGMCNLDINERLSGDLFHELNDDDVIDIPIVNINLFEAISFSVLNDRLCGGK